MKNNYLKLSLICMSVIMVSCKENKETTDKKEGESATVTNVEKRLENRVLTKEDQDKLTPDGVLADFKAGNERFRNNNNTVRDYKEQIRKSAVGQFPKAFVLGCVDSRAPIEDIFDQGIGDVFVGRVAGNFADENMLGSMEFACKVAGAKLIMVMAHQHCGAIKATIDNVDLGNITSLVDNIKPAIGLSASFLGEKNSKNEEYVKIVAENNVRNTIKNIRENSPILKEMEDKGEIKIVGAFYTLTKGELIFVE
ncbi:carbonic anhydrase [Flavobacterium segetis]|uniref:Carbonic anhydrase n=1 Tax=Flavobacterium segetis TaxID=271157 RepID=A0A1M5FX36_9FLAO|nr:carbonic anhydrase family protein [Flavobacterium segetis]SHF96023.1 carbonic anhydrase [Flavobacterium segetis]